MLCFWIFTNKWIISRNKSCAIHWGWVSWPISIIDVLMNISESMNHDCIRSNIDSILMYSFTFIYWCQSKILSSNLIMPITAIWHISIGVNNDVKKEISYISAINGRICFEIMNRTQTLLGFYIGSEQISSSFYGKWHLLSGGMGRGLQNYYIYIYIYIYMTHMKKTNKLRF